MGSPPFFIADTVNHERKPEFLNSKEEEHLVFSGWWIGAALKKLKLFPFSFFIHNVYDDMMYLLFLYWRTEKKLQSLQKQEIAAGLQASPEAEGVSLPEETGPDCVQGLGLSTGNPLSLPPGYSPGSNCRSPDARPSRHSCSRGGRRWHCGTHCGYSDNRCGSCSTSCGIHHRPL